MIKNFCRQENEVRFMPVRLEVFRIGIKMGSVKNVFKYLQWHSEAYSLFTEEHPNIAVKKYKLAELWWKMPRNICKYLLYTTKSPFLQELHRVLPDDSIPWQALNWHLLAIMIKNLLSWHNVFCISHENVLRVD